MLWVTYLSVEKNLNLRSQTLRSPILKWANSWSLTSFSFSPDTNTKSPTSCQISWNLTRSQISRNPNLKHSTSFSKSLTKLFLRFSTSIIPNARSLSSLLRNSTSRGSNSGNLNLFSRSSTYRSLILRRLNSRDLTSLSTITTSKVPLELFK